MTGAAVGIVAGVPLTGLFTGIGAGVLGAIVLGIGRQVTGLFTSD
jgi:hypothetical protein